MNCLCKNLNICNAGEIPIMLITNLGSMTTDPLTFRCNNFGIALTICMILPPIRFEVFTISRCRKFVNCEIILTKHLLWRQYLYTIVLGITVTILHNLRVWIHLHNSPYTLKSMFINGHNFTYKAFKLKQYFMMSDNTGVKSSDSWQICHTSWTVTDLIYTE